jgi:hypothetical protein
MIERLNVTPILTNEQLKSLRLRLLTPAQGRTIDRSTEITCEGKVKALLLKADGPDKPIKAISYDAALRALQLMRPNFNPASHSRRGSIHQKLVGGDLLLGWMDVCRPPWEDIFRAGHRDNFVAAIWLKPLLDDFAQALEEHLPEYWQFHMAQARRLVRPPDDRLQTLDKVTDYYQREMLEQWDQTRCYHFPGTEAFSTLTLNHNILFGAHDDGRNIPGTLSCLTALGNYVGGTLCFPRLGISFNLRPGDVLIADANEEYHGTVGGIIGDRFSVVAYLHGSLLPR